MDERELDQTSGLLVAMADMQGENDRRYTSLSARMDRIERKGGGSGEQLIDNKTIGMLIAITVIPIALQVIGMIMARNAAKT